MNDYTNLQQRHQNEISALPICFAFGDKQFRSMMENWGLDPEKDLDKICCLGGTGGFYKRTDSQVILETFARHQQEREDAITADITGEGYIYQMFYQELVSHEYGYTGDTEATLDALGYTAQEVISNPRLKRGIEKAVTQIMKEEG